MELLMKLQGLI